MYEVDLSQLSKEELIDLIKAYSRLFLALDGCWFLIAEEELGYGEALKIDIKAWEKYSPFEAKLLRKTLGITKGGIQGIIETLKHSAFVPCMEHKIREVSEERGNIAFYNCPSLMAMERAGRKEFSCEPVGTVMFNAYAKSIDPRAKARFVSGPPRKSSEDVCCEWEFMLENAED